VNRSKSCVAAAGCEDVRLGAMGKFFKAAKYVVANASERISVCGKDGWWGYEKAYRDLNDPEGWRFSSFRKILLLRFRTPLS
jgi:hypothetical protein